MGTLTYSLYGVAGLSSLILIGAFIAMCQRSIVISGGGRSYDEDGNESDESEQHNNYHSLSSNPVVAPRSGGDGRRAVSRDKAVKRSEAKVAANRFREKYSDMYDKYNIQSSS